MSEGQVSPYMANVADSVSRYQVSSWSDASPIGLLQWLSMGTDIQAKCESVVQGIGIRNGQTVLDFGCGAGCYTIPAAKLVGQQGRVYAIEQNKSRLQELSQHATLEGVDTIIKVRETDGEVALGIPSASVDVTLLYDIFWYFPIGRQLRDLLKEVYRVLKSDGILSVFPQHVDVAALRREIEAGGFSLQGQITTQVVHEGRLESGQIISYRKKKSTTNA